MVDAGIVMSLEATNTQHQGTGSTASQSVLLLVRPSKRLWLFIGVTHALAVVVPWITPISWYFCLVLNLCALLSFLLCRRQHYWRGSRRLQIVDDRWYWTSVCGDDEEVVLVGESFVSPYLVILRFRRQLAAETRSISLAQRLQKVLFTRFSLVLLPDSADADSLRRLRVWLRFHLNQT